MSGRRTATGPRSRRRNGPAGPRSVLAGDRQAPQRPLAAAAQIFLGVSLSCLIVALGSAAVLGAIVLVLYLAK